MQFRPALARAIREGRRSVTRRRAGVYDRRLGPAGDYERVYRAATDRLIYQKHGSYAVQPGRGSKSVARIQIDRIDLGYLHEMNLSDARLEGFADLDGFRRVWRGEDSQWGPTRRGQD